MAILVSSLGSMYLSKHPICKTDIVNCRWWVHPVFAFHDGIIDSPDPLGGITADQDGAYAILLTNSDESSSHNAEHFTYRCHAKDKGKFRLMNAILPPKQSIRVLRSHTLRAPHSPAAGVRYEGL